jgi:arylsulfatase A-like enzyme
LPGTSLTSGSQLSGHGSAAVASAATQLTPRGLIACGALYGAAAWTVYWIIECIYVSILPWLLTPGYAYRPAHPGFSALLVVIYLCCGSLLGALAGWVMQAAGRRRFSAEQSTAVGVLLLILAFTANFVPLQSDFTRRAASCLALYLLLAAAALATAFSVGSRKFRVLANPWTVSIMLIGAPWGFAELDDTHWSSLIKALLVLAGLAAVLLAAALIARLLDRRIERASSVRRVLIPLALPVALLLGVGFLLHQRALVQPPSAAALTDPARPNVLLVTLDTVRADHLSAYGYDRRTTPNLSDFAQHATLYANAISPSDMTLSSHASIFTGLYASRHGAHWVTGQGTVSDAGSGTALPDSFPTLAGILSQKGYLTAGVVANDAFLQHSYALDRGFQYYSQAGPVLFLAPSTPFLLRDRVGSLLRRFSLPADYDRAYRRAGEINSETFGLLDRAKSTGQRFFLFLNYMDAHEMYYPPHPFDTLYPGKDPHLDNVGYWRIEKEVLSSKETYSDRDRQRDISQYDGGIAYADYELGNLLKRLQSLGLYDNTIIVITSDHGQSFGERHLLGHGSSVYQDQTHVPLIIHFPQQRDAHVVQERVSGVDLLPTILAVLKLPAPSGLDGRSLSGTTPDPQRSIIAESFTNDFRISLNPKFRRIERAIFDGPYKLIAATNGKREMYNLSSDPNESQNLYRPDDSLARQLEARLDDWVRKNAKLAGPRAVLDRHARENLRSLGYVQ